MPRLTIGRISIRLKIHFNKKLNYNLFFFNVHTVQIELIIVLQMQNYFS